MQKASKIILGIDPGTIIMGYGIIEAKGTSIQLLEMNVLKLSAKLGPYEKLERIHHSVQQLIAQYKPGHFAIEAPFFGKNVQSMLKLGRAQGVAIAAAIQAGLPVNEYSPKKVKQSITGNGNADKEQVMKMLMHLLKFEKKPSHMDASDGLAVAVCHHFQQNNPISGSTSKTTLKGWRAFMEKYPSRVK